MGEDIEDDYPVCRRALERSNSKKVAYETSWER
jgi:hypothetical protein